MKKGNMSPASFGLLIFIICICAAVGVVVAGYLPMREYSKLEEQCDKSATGYVYKKSGQTKEGIYYYGPDVAYMNSSNGGMVHASVMSTVKNSKVSTWDKDTLIVVKYSSGDASLVLFDERNDTSVQSYFKRMSVIAAVIGGLGAAVLVMSLINQYSRTRPVNYDHAPDGASFEEWQQKKQLEDQAAEAEKKMNAAEESDKEEASQDG